MRLGKAADAHMRRDTAPDRFRHERRKGGRIRHRPVDQRVHGPFWRCQPSQSGILFRSDAYHYNGSADTTIFDGRIALGVDQDYTASLFALTYVTPWKILGGTYAVAVVPTVVP